MKKVLFPFMFLMGVTMLSSCTNNEESDSNTKNESPKVSGIQSTLRRSEMLDVQKSIVGCFYGAHRRAEEVLSETDAKQMLSPLVADGTAIVGQIQEAAKAGELEMTAQEALQLETMTDEQLAELSFVVYNLNDPLMMDELFSYIQQEIDSNAIPISDEPGAYTKKELVDCLTATIGATFGFGAFDYIWNTAELITAKTAFRLAMTFIGRTTGWISMAMAMYEYGNGLHSKKKGNQQ